MSKIKLFLDTEFTGLHQDTSLISIGIVSECGKTFYAETNDYKGDQVDDWIKENIINKLTHNGIYQEFQKQNGSISYKSTSENIAIKLGDWLSQFHEVEIWSDCLAYDWVLFCQLFGGAFSIPKNIYYIPFDLATLFKAKDIDPDVNREKFGCGEVYAEMPKHNSLWDARVIKMCYDKLMK